MARKWQAKSGAPVICAYCAQPTTRLEEEHPFPESWYPKGTPPSAMLLVPSCTPCNQRFQKLEVVLFPKLVLTLGNKNPAASAGLVERLARSMKPEAGKPGRDSRARAAKKRKFFDSVEVTSVADDRGRPLVTNYKPEDSWIRTPEGLLVRGALKVTIGHELDAVAEKIVRGCYYDIEGKPLAPGVPIAIRHPSNSEEVVSVVEYASKVKDQLTVRPRPGFDSAVMRASEIDQIWIVRLWEEIYFYALIGTLVSRFAAADSATVPSGC